eukprot:SAG22_NODE_2642_length_2345_cov_1.625111_2_plen_458_part_01
MGDRRDMLARRATSGSAALRTAAAEVSGSESPWEFSRRWTARAGKQRRPPERQSSEHVARRSPGPECEPISVLLPDGAMVRAGRVGESTDDYRMSALPRAMPQPLLLAGADEEEEEEEEGPVLVVAEFERREAAHSAEVAGLKAKLAELEAELSNRGRFDVQMSQALQQATWDCAAAERRLREARSVVVVGGGGGAQPVWGQQVEEAVPPAAALGGAMAAQRARHRNSEMEVQAPLDPLPQHSPGPTVPPGSAAARVARRREFLALEPQGDGAGGGTVLRWQEHAAAARGREATPKPQPAALPGSSSVAAVASTRPGPRRKLGPALGRLGAAGQQSSDDVGRRPPPLPPTADPPPLQLIATVGCESSGIARKGRETDGKAVITAFKLPEPARPPPLPPATPEHPAAAARGEAGRQRGDEAYQHGEAARAEWVALAEAGRASYMTNARTESCRAATAAA